MSPVLKFNCSVEIKKPINQVIDLFDNPQNMKHWQDGFGSFTPLSGTPGQPGAQAKLLYRSGKQEIELIETITARDLPHEFSGTYEHKHMTNTMKNFFTGVNENTTRWEAQLEYSRISGFMPKLMAFLMPGMFRKQTRKWLDQFKVFAENQS